MTAGHVEWMDGLVGGRRTCLRRRVSKKFLMPNNVAAREFQRRIGDRRLWTRGKVFSSKASTGR